MANEPTSPKKSKHFIPLENNPEVMTTLLHKLGLSPTLQFHDVYSISDPDLLSFVPRPALALLLVFPITKTYETHRTSEDASLPAYTSSGPHEETIWYRQTIGNACGLIGLLHAVSNGAAREAVGEGSELDTFIRQAVELEPDRRAELVEKSDALEKAHADAAAGGDSAAPGRGEDVDLHFVCFVKSGRGGLWEMDGRRKGPIARGRLGEGEDVLSERALDLGVRAFLRREEEAGGGDLRFSLIALGPSLD